MLADLSQMAVIAREDRRWLDKEWFAFTGKNSFIKEELMFTVQRHPTMSKRAMPFELKKTGGV